MYSQGSLNYLTHENGCTVISSFILLNGLSKITACGPGKFVLFIIDSICAPIPVPKYIINVIDDLSFKIEYVTLIYLKNVHTQKLHCLLNF